MSRLQRIRLAVSVAIALMGSVLASVPIASGSHGSFTTSSATYRIPYANLTMVSANNDHHTHPNAFDRVDLGGPSDSIIVAAASGMIRGLVDWNGDDNDLGDGVGVDGQPQDDDLEHGCQDDSTVAGDCTDYNNYVWVQHANGEWTKYTHFQTGSVTGLGWSVGDTILVGQSLGVQGDVGAAGATTSTSRSPSRPIRPIRVRSARSADSFPTRGTS